jgi:hypothetical protein
MGSRNHPHYVLHILLCDPLMRAVEVPFGSRREMMQAAFELAELWGEKPPYASPEALTRLMALDGRLLSHNGRPLSARDAWLEEQWRFLSWHVDDADSQLKLLLQLARLARREHPEWFSYSGSGLEQDRQAAVKIKKALQRMGTIKG